MRTLRLGVGHGNITKSKDNFDIFLEEIQESRSTDQANKKVKFDTEKDPKKPSTSMAAEESDEEMNEGLEPGVRQAVDNALSELGPDAPAGKVMELLQPVLLKNVDVSLLDVINYVTAKLGKNLKGSLSGASKAVAEDEESLDTAKGAGHPGGEEDDPAIIGDEEEMKEGSFSRKHFQMIADILKQWIEGGTEEEREVASGIARDFVEMFLSENPRFDSEKFLKAVGF